MRQTSLASSRQVALLESRASARWPEVKLSCIMLKKLAQSREESWILQLSSAKDANSTFMVGLDLLEDKMTINHWPRGGLKVERRRTESAAIKGAHCHQSGRRAI